MKKFILMMVIFLSGIGVRPMQAETPKELFTRLEWSDEKAQPFIIEAKRVCAEVAPDINIEGTLPTLFSCNLDYMPDMKGRNIVVVFFLRTPDDYVKYGVRTVNGKSQYIKKPQGVINVLIDADSKEPLGIFADRGVFFSPSYKEFRKDNPDFRLKKSSEDGVKLSMPQRE